METLKDKLNKSIRAKCIINTSPDSGHLRKYDSLETIIKNIVSKLNTNVVISPEPVIVPPQPTLQFIKYGATNLDTSTINHTLNDYINSVNLVIAANGQLQESFVSNIINFTVTNFGNTSDKVLFILIPLTEQPFIKWSEVGNTFQQDMTIDPDFTNSNLWFKTISGNNNLYITRVQTTFTGPIILTR